MKTRYLVLGIALVAVAAAQPLGAATATGSLTVGATVSARASLVLGVGSINFPDTDPGTASIPANTTVSVTAKGRAAKGNSITVTVLASNDLTATGADPIAISNVTWTAAGADFVAGTMNKTTAQPVATWTNSGERTGTLSFVLANSWSYQVGSYSTSTTFTLTAE